MDISPNSFVSVEGILADVLKVVQDSSFKTNSPGWYKSQVRQALNELSFDTYFSELNQIHDIKDGLAFDMPKGAFNIKQIYVFDGSECVIGQNSKTVWWKRNFIRGEKGGYVARDKYHNGDDPFYKSRSNNIRSRAARGDEDRLSPNNVRFFGIQNGKIMLSDSCAKFQKVFVVYNGIAGDINAKPIVPEYLRQAVKDYVTVEALVVKMAEAIGGNDFNKWSTLLARTEARKDKPFDGTWAKAEHRVTSMSSKQREDLKEYLSKIDD